MGNKNTRKRALRRKRVKARYAKRDARIAHILEIVSFSDIISQGKFVFYLPCLEKLLTVVTPYEYRHLAKDFSWLEVVLNSYNIKFISGYDKDPVKVDNAVHGVGSFISYVSKFPILCQNDIENKFLMDYVEGIFHSLYYSELWYSYQTRDYFFRFVNSFVE